MTRNGKPSPPVELSQLDQSELEGSCLLCEEGRANSIGYLRDDVGRCEFERWDGGHVSRKVEILCTRSARSVRQSGLRAPGALAEKLGGSVAGWLNWSNQLMS